MNIRHIISIAAGLIYAVSAVLYVNHNIKGKIHPNIASFTIWSFMNLSQLIALIVSHAWNSVPFLIVATISSIAVSVIALRYKRFYFSMYDALAICVGILALLVWAITRNAAWNVYILTFVGAVTFSPLIIKVFRRPELETVLPWRLNFLGSILLVAAIPSTAIVQWIVPAQQFICSGLLNLGLLKQKQGGDTR